MGIKEKKQDSLKRISGKESDTFRQDASLLLQGLLPSGWEWVPCSEDTVVARRDAPFLVYYKEFLPRNKLESLKAFFRGSRCLRARRQTKILQSAGLPTPDILCWGAGNKNEFFFSDGVSGLGFYFFLRNTFPAPSTRKDLTRKHLLLKETGKLIGRLHQAGIIHGDLRPNNLLVEEGKTGFEFSFIDNESNKLKKTPSFKSMIKNIVQFSMIQDSLLSHSDLLRIFSAYCTEFHFFSSKVGQRKLISEVFAIRQKRLALHHLKICQENRSGQIQKVRGKNCGAYYRKSAIEKIISQNMDLEKWFAQSDKTIKKDGSITVKELAVDGETLLAKKITRKNLGDSLRGHWKKNRVQHLWNISHAFLDLDMPVPQPRGYFVSESKKENYFFCEHLSSAKTLLSISMSQTNFAEWLSSNALLENIAASLARMHNYGYTHGDTKWANIMIDSSGDSFWWIDLDGVRHHRKQFNRWIFKDIARFVVDILESNLNDAFAETFIKKYGKKRGVHASYIEQHIKPFVNKIRKRHLRHSH